MALLSDLLSLDFFVRSLALTVMVSFFAGYYGVFVVQRQMSFLGSGLAHAAFGSVALALLLNTEPLYVAIPATLIGASFIHWLGGRGLSADSATGILFSLSMALGILFLSLRDSFGQDAFAYLFGSILYVETIDLWIAAGLFLITVASFVFWGRWAYSGLDGELARSDGARVERDEWLLVSLVALVIVLSIKLIGAVLITAFLVLPASAARLISRSFARMTILSIVFSVAGALGGLLISALVGVPASAAIVLLHCAILGLCILIQALSMR
ncbi:MAG: metal ABC transporter permease [Leptospiraceae bacterium]|nr:metal ABC transporter permease [Leptospiraceae bacterium]MCB1305347.1 metal ABC transporter permease [Leptospiraceae bacterium]